MPRMELQAAVLSTKMAAFLEQELPIPYVSSQYFWTDSKIVLGYVRNESRQFHMYVANRVKQIRDKTAPEQWHFIPGELNPADIASRGSSVCELTQSSWFVGPKFLLYTTALSRHLGCSQGEVSDSDPEVKRSLATSHSIESPDMILRLEKFSDFNAAIRAISALQRCLNHSQSSVQGKERAKRTIIKWVQIESLPDYKILKEGAQVSKSSPIRKLDPFIDNEGLMRVGGRIRASELYYDEVHPFVLPKRAHITNLIVKMCHERVMHQGQGMSMQELRSQGFYVIGASAVVAKHIRSCVECRRQRRPLELQKMADLPSERLTPCPPFTYVGADCFGPFLVKDYRKEIKRYGVVFTCMASRAVHLEVLDNMTSDDIINAIRRVIAIRGPIRQLRSDQGSNFVGAANEFKKNLRLQHFLLENNIDFVFNTPRASHQGGVWERQIRSIRNVLNSMLSLQKASIDSTTLRTFMYEAMAIVNSRPLTTVASDTFPLTPNMLLTMKTGIVLPPPPGEFEDADLYSKKRWKRVQSLANTFWVRWRREYIHSLQSRSKWQVNRPNIKVGDIVIVKEESAIRNRWPMAKVVEVAPGSDGLVRHVKIQMADSNIDDRGKRHVAPRLFDRPIQKLVVLCSP